MNDDIQLQWDQVPHDDDDSGEDAPQDVELEECGQLDSYDDEFVSSYQRISLEDEPEQRQMPWALDMLFYPMNGPGLTIIGIVVGLPLILAAAATVFMALGPLMLIGLLFMYINFIVIIPICVSYMFWYFGLCINTSAYGQVRAPETLALDADGGVLDLIWIAFKLIGCTVLFLGAGAVYYLIQRRMDLWFYLVTVLGIFVYPMAVLSLVMHDSLAGVNPWIIARSIIKTFRQYCLVCIVYLLLVVIVAACFGLGIYIRTLIPVLGRAAGIGFSFMWMYFLLVAGHILGRFYFRNEHKLEWEV